ncbi:hypothetical protein V8B97DRAFT_1920892 [Scleroderma yunnanense]
MSWYYHIHQYVLSKFTNFILVAVVSIGGSGSGGQGGDHHCHTGDVVNTWQWMVEVVVVIIHVGVGHPGGGSGSHLWRRLHHQHWWWGGSDGQVIKIIIIVIKMEVVAIIAIWWSMPGVVAVEDRLSEDEGLRENSEVIYHFTTPKVTTTTMHQLSYHFFPLLMMHR